MLPRWWNARSRCISTELVEVQPVVAVLAHIEAQRGRIPFAIVSGSPRVSVVRTIENLG